MNSSELCKLLDEAGYDPRSYSGRGMFGRSCVSVTLNMDSYTLFQHLADILDCWDEGWNISPAELLRGLHQDNMGRDLVIYWPDVEWVENES